MTDFRHITKSARRSPWRVHHTQGDEAMFTTTSRRNALALVATLPALAVAAPAARAAPAPDPILDAIAKHRECYKAAEGLVAAREKLETSTPHVSEYIDPEQPNNFALAFDRQCAANPEFERAVEVAAKAMQTEYEAGQELLHTAPATVAGAIAALTSCSRMLASRRKRPLVGPPFYQ
jgi:hypothetical protein